MIKLQVNHEHHLLQTKLRIDTSSQQTYPQSQLPTQQNIIQKNQSSSLKDKQSQTISNIQLTQLKLKKGLQDMINEYKSQAEKMMQNHGYDPQKEAQIKRHLLKLQKQKQQRQKKMKIDLQRLELKKNALDKLNNNQPQQIQERRKIIQKRIQLIHQRQKKRQQQYSDFSRFYQQYKLRKPKYKQIQEQFCYKQQKQKQQKIKNHKIRLQEVYKPMDLQKLSHFQQGYIQSRYQAEKQRLQNILYQKKQQEANFMKLNQLYKGQAHSYLLQELKQRNQKNKQAQVKYHRIKDYSLKVKEQHQPRVRSSIDEQQDESQVSSTKIPQTERGRRVIKDRYLKGEYQGKMIQYEKVPLSFSQQVHKGLQYLQFLKGLPKKQKSKEKSEIIQPTPRKVTPVFRIQRLQNPLYRGRRYKSIDFDHLEDGDSVKRTINFMKHRKDELKMQQKVLRNRHFKNRQQWQQGQKEFNSMLIGSIEQKLQILNKL